MNVFLAAAAPPPGSDAVTVVMEIMFGVAAFAGYWLPSFVAVVRGAPGKAQVVVVNLFLGWTVVGWVVALVMALRPKPVQFPPPYMPYGPRR